MKQIRIGDITIDARGDAARSDLAEWLRSPPVAALLRG